MALVKQFQPPQPRAPTQPNEHPLGDAQAGDDHTGSGESMFERGGALRWLAARGGMLEWQSGATLVEAGSEGVGQKRMRVEPEESWFRFAAVTNPWEVRLGEARGGMGIQGRCVGSCGVLGRPRLAAFIGYTSRSKREVLVVSFAACCGGGRPRVPSISSEMVTVLYWEKDVVFPGAVSAVGRD